ncbi:hypothetical protein GYMLUDRAFT_596557 [Collybiopsis luxurians FD-317 M1]|uniref:Uncharacterized protein n=1 Tax=Collybiopsis luxurians FD-317 M1 TaxID=944289 RepID=A0A0D0CPM6_9AGAR|nr:hypothetical protein GYMLUDRAFT_596557 [Collybiopsis luxurians FD-317 M1]
MEHIGVIDQCQLRTTNSAAIPFLSPLDLPPSSSLHFLATNQPLFILLFLALLNYHHHRHRNQSLLLPYLVSSNIPFLFIRTCSKGLEKVPSNLTSVISLVVNPDEQLHPLASPPKSISSMSSTSIRTNAAGSPPSSSSSSPSHRYRTLTFTRGTKSSCLYYSHPIYIRSYPCTRTCTHTHTCSGVHQRPHPTARNQCSSTACW